MTEGHEGEVASGRSRAKLSGVEPLHQFGHERLQSHPVVACRHPHVVTDAGRSVVDNDQVDRTDYRTKDAAFRAP